MNIRITTRQNDGFMVLLTVLITSVILAISLSIYSITLKELVLSSFLENAEKAFGAADRGIECALYWDRATGAARNGMQYTIFATSTAWTPDSLTMANAKCNNGAVDVVITNTLAPVSWVSTPIDANHGLTTFSLSFSDGTCVDMTVAKDFELTTVTANGYNTCGSSPRKTQRTIQTRYNL